MATRFNYFKLHRNINVLRGLCKRRVAAKHYYLNREQRTSSLWQIAKCGISTNSQMFASSSHATGNSGVKICPSIKGNTLDVTWEDGTVSKFHSVWLRHNCQCSKCIQAASGQKIIDLNNIARTFSITHAQLNDNCLIVHVAEEDHVIEIPLDNLRNADYSDESIAAELKRRTPPFLNHDETGCPIIEYEEILASPEGKYKWFSGMNEVGLCLIKNVPKEEKILEKVAELIWPCQRTIYGELFRVENTPKPINIAFSTANLPFHMDLVYYESPPGLQFLHAIRYDSCVTGGESMFVDSFAVAEQLREEDPSAFDVLKRQPTTFQKVHYDREKPVHIVCRRPIIVVNDRDMITNINWAPAFEGPLKIPPADVEAYYDAYIKFANLIQSTKYRAEFRLEEGDLVCFNNRRTLHARKEFELNGGSRLLMGCYINIDEFESEVHVLSKQLGYTNTTKRTFNQNYF